MPTTTQKIIIAASLAGIGGGVWYFFIRKPPEVKTETITTATNFSNSFGKGTVNPEYVKSVKYVVDSLGNELFLPKWEKLMDAILVRRAYDAVDAKKVSKADWKLLTDAVNSLKKGGS